MDNLTIDNAEQISQRYGEITRALNLQFRQTDSRLNNSRQVGSYGRKTAIKGISDLDMLYIMPPSAWNDYKDGGQYRLLRKTADAINARYTNTNVYVDGLVVRALFTNFHIEVQPVFAQLDGNFLYPHTRAGGAWKITMPQKELSALSEANINKNNNLRRLCKMTRAWKNKHGVAMGGLLIDSLAHRFLKQTNYYDDKSFQHYDLMVRDFFDYLKNLEKKEYFLALGSAQRVKVKKNFQNKAKKAHQLCLEAISAESNKNRNEKWRLIFGRGFPPAQEVINNMVLIEGAFKATNTEQYIEDKFPIDIRNSITIECEVTQAGFQTRLLKNMIGSSLPLFTRKSLRFFIEDTDITGKYTLYWKVLNRGAEAIRRNIVRGQILKDNGKLEQIEKTNFEGDHVVDCYAVKNNVVIAKDRIHVSIDQGIEH